jgi:hypothetical protein
VFSYADIMGLARQMKTRTAELLALAPNNDPFAAEINGRQQAAEWFVEVSDKLDMGHSFHTRRMHYRIIMRPELGIVKPDGSAYLNLYNDWTMLTQACRDARYLGLVSRPNYRQPQSRPVHLRCIRPRRRA